MKFFPGDKVRGILDGIHAFGTGKETEVPGGNPRDMETTCKLKPLTPELQGKHASH